LKARNAVSASRNIVGRTPSGRDRRIRRCCYAAIEILGFLSLIAPAKAQQQSGNLADKSLEDLMEIQVTSVSKKEQKLSQVAAAIFVITQEDIRRSGATNIPDLLRMVPGINVAQINAHTWAISSRGFNEEFSDKLLVLLDGRAVYTPTFSGVFWDTLDVPLEDIERIEVMRGPGATIWGVNAVNGVINILTKKASEMRGGLVSAGFGTQAQGLGTAQYDGAIGAKTDYRIFGNYTNVSDFTGKDGQPSEDGWHMLRGGARLDAAPSSKDAVMLRGDIYTGEAGTIQQDVISISPPLNGAVTSITSLSGGDIVARWTEEQSASSDTSLLVYFDRYERASSDRISERRNTYDIEFQHHVRALKRNDIVWGLTYRNSRGTTQGNLNFSFDPASHTSQFFSFYAQDEIAVVPDRLLFTIGARWGWDDYTGYEVQPTARMLWAPTAKQAVWFAVSHAQRNPSFLETSVRQNTAAFLGPGGVPSLESEFGNPLQKEEALVAWEIGYRRQFSKRLSMESAAFFNHYSDIGSTEPLAPFSESTPPLHMVIPFVNGNGLHGETHGLEMAGNWQVSGRWSLRASYALLEMHMHRDATSQDTESAPEIEGSDPRDRAGLRSHVSLWSGISWDASAEYVDRLRAQGVPSYTRVDTQILWHVGERFTASVVGQNLLRDHHVEFNDDFGNSVSDEIKRSAYVKLAWRF
jgi:iron complex outermembrane recepter protein